MKVEYHTHSIHSDGIFSPIELIDRACAEGITSFAITDHDTVAGIAQARAYAAGKLTYFPALEITCAEQDFSPLCSVHLLGYNISETNPHLLQVLNTRAQQQNACFTQVVDFLSTCGCSISLNDVPISCGHLLQLCDIIAYVSDRVSADTQTQLSAYAPRFAMANLSVTQAIHAIHQAGGKVVWAHPFIAYHNLSRRPLSTQEVTQVFTQLLSLGIDGIEAHYASFSPQQIDFLTQLAHTHGLFCSAGSDFHGYGGRAHMGLSVSPAYALSL